MSPGTELTEVELPLIRQLVGLGWQHVTGSKDTPSVTERESFREVLLTARLRSAIRNLNPGPDDALGSMRTESLRRPLACSDWRQRGSWRPIKR